MIVFVSNKAIECNQHYNENENFNNVKNNEWVTDRLL